MADYLFVLSILAIGKTNLSHLPWVVSGDQHQALPVEIERSQNAVFTHLTLAYN